MTIAVLPDGAMETHSEENLNMHFTDAVTVAGTRRTGDGYLVAEARAVRTGIQIYLGDEVGKPEMQTVRVYRGPDEVFSDASLQSFTHAPVTINHPKDQVTSANWKDLAVGEVSTMAKKDGEWVWLPLILKDAKGIAEVEGGKRELSAGYTCELDWTPGVAADGQPFDAQQKNIKINHLAIVDAARAGSKARIGDDAGKWGAAPITPNPEKETRAMSDALRTVVVDGLSVSTTDQGAQAITKLQAALADSAANVTKLQADHAAALAAKDAEIAKAHAERDAEKAKVLSDADLDKRVAARADLIGKAKAIAKDVKTDGLSDAAIRKAAVALALGDEAVKDKADAYIDARFDILVEDAAKKSPDTFRATMQQGVLPVADANAVATAHKAMTDDMSKAWQTKGAA